MSLAEVARSMRALQVAAERSPLNHIRWLPGQRAFLSDPSPRKLFRAGNQSQGKTTAGLAEVVFRCIGVHPFLQIAEPPIEAWVVCASWSQSLAIQAKLWDMVPKDLVHPDTVFCPVKGFRGVNPACQFLNGSIIRIKTTQQGGLSLAGSTIDCALFDEPPKTSRVYGEVQKRVMRAGRDGVVMLCLTPVNAPCDWLREACEEGLITDHHYRLTPANVIPVGYSEPLTLRDGSVCDQKWIDRVVAETMSWEVPVVVHGEWEMKSVGSVFADFRDADHITHDLPKGQVQLSIGIDHGDGANFSQAAVLIAVDDSGEYPKIYVLDEYISESTTTPDMDAASIRVMLRRHQLDWADLDHVWGDRAYPGRRGGASKKSNQDMIHAMARELGVPYSRIRPTIRTVKRGRNRGAGSVHRGVRFLHYAMVRPGHFHINPRCVHMIECLKRWELKDDGYKHVIDALRYSLQTWIFARRRQQGQAVRIGA